MNENCIGHIVYLNEEKGYGFIQVEGYIKNVFFHAKDVRRVKFAQLRKSDKVSIGKITQNEKGLTASEVFLVS